MKQKVTLSIDAELIRAAKEKGIALSWVAEDAIREKVNMPLEEVENSYPFEMCEREINGHIKKILFGCASIKARRCQTCNGIFYVNDPHGEFKVCESCFNKKKLQ